LLRVRMHTTGFARHDVSLDNNTFSVIDVGGMRCERRKWETKLKDADAIFFVAALTDWSQSLFEDESSNRMTDSLQVFAELAKNPTVADCPICLFLTKVDMLPSRIQTHSAQLEQWLSSIGADGGAITDAQALSTLIKEKFMQSCARCSQVHIIDGLDLEQAKRSVRQAAMLALTVNRRRRSSANES